MEEMDASIGAILSVVREQDEEQRRQRQQQQRVNDFYNISDSSSDSYEGTLVIFTSDNGAWVGANTGLSNARINAASSIGPASTQIRRL